MLFPSMSALDKSSELGFPVKSYIPAWRNPFKILRFWTLGLNHDLLYERKAWHPLGKQLYSVNSNKENASISGNLLNLEEGSEVYLDFFTPKEVFTLWFCTVWAFLTFSQNKISRFRYLIWETSMERLWLVVLSSNLLFVKYFLDQLH